VHRRLTPAEAGGLLRRAGARLDHPRQVLQLRQVFEHHVPRARPRGRGEQAQAVQLGRQLGLHVRVLRNQVPARARRPRLSQPSGPWSGLLRRVRSQRRPPQARLLPARRTRARGSGGSLPRHADARREWRAARLHARWRAAGLLVESAFLPEP